MPNVFLTTLLLSVGVGTWVYAKLSQRSGYGNNQNALLGAAVAAGLAFLVALSIGLALF